MLDSMGFILFSIIEGVGLFVLMLSIFRLKITDHLWQAMVMILIMSFQSYLLRFNFDLPYLVPVINLVLFSLLLATVWRVSVVWSVIISITGYMAFGMIQTATVFIIFSSVEATTSTLEGGYALQSVSGILTTLLGLSMYRFGIGFTFDFDKLRIRFERFVVIGMIIVFLVLFIVVMYKNELWLNLVFTLCAMALLLHYAIKKEREYYD